MGVKIEGKKEIKQESGQRQKDKGEKKELCDEEDSQVGHSTSLRCSKKQNQGRLLQRFGWHEVLLSSLKRIKNQKDFVSNAVELLPLQEQQQQQQNEKNDLRQITFQNLKRKLNHEL